MYEKTIWVTGAEGSLGQKLIEKLEEDVTIKVIGTDIDVDVTNMDEVNSRIDIYRPNIVVNCASLSDADYCEEHMVEAFKVNALGARNLAIASRRHNAKILQLSSDDVFEGKRSDCLTEFDIPTPRTVYGKSKLAGENYIKELNPKHLIVRSSWVYGTGSPRDYFEYVVKNGRENTPFEANMDKISSPTCADDLIDFILTLIDKTEYGIYHASCEGACTRLGFAAAILEGMGYDSSLAKGVFANKNGLHTSTLLENLMMKMTDIYDMPKWQDGLKRYISSVKGE